ncbi:MAG: hypothetical protein LBE36_11985 [Flavobacteriaceae bacterium]|jgi:hypothetical protein|nr:hypothetical protein [Flavobacteriaceae bacterium]
MIHTVHIDDTTTTGKKLLEKLREYKDGVRFEESTDNNIPDGYITVEEFRTETKKLLTETLI